MSLRVRSLIPGETRRSRRTSSWRAGHGQSDRAQRRVHVRTRGPGAPDGGTRYLGKGVRKAVTNIIEIIGPAVAGFDATEQATIDNTMIALDGTETKKKLGANAMLAVSLAVAKRPLRTRGSPLQLLGGRTRRNCRCR